MRRKGELSGKQIDSGWPFQVALPSHRTLGAEYVSARLFCERLSLCPRNHCFVRDGQYVNVWPFALLEDAEAFAAKFGGELISVKDRPKWGRNGQ